MPGNQSGVIDFELRRMTMMNQEGVNSFKSCHAYFQAMSDRGYSTLLQGSAQGGIKVSEDAVVTLDKKCGLPEEVVSQALKHGAEDRRIGIANLLKRVAESRNEVLPDSAQVRIRAANDATTPSTETLNSLKPE